MNNSLEIVIVLYECPLDKSVTFLTLTDQLKKTSIDYELVIYNNDIHQKIEDSRFIIVNSEVNKKLEGAYNFALERAIRNGKKWILLLDQDTLIPDNYFDELNKLFTTNLSPHLVAIVPKLVCESKILSPKLLSSKMRFESDIPNNGYTNERIVAFNSMSLFSVHFIQSIGGFSMEYPFDLHDHWCYNQIYKNKKQVYILDVSTEHNSSFINFEENVTIARYKDFLRTENRFMRNEMGMPYYIFYKIKLMMRVFKQFLIFKNKNYSMQTFLFIFKK